ncbi:MAG: hypothetical protein LUD17_05335 [Bacteroidales bacterium]|nr:hypothetical protein [Bacteroidales bacterium]
MGYSAFDTLLPAPENGVSYWIVPSDSVVRRLSTGVLMPSRISATRMKADGSSTPAVTTDYTLRYIVYDSSGLVLLSGNVSNGQYITIPTKAVSIRFLMGSGSTTIALTTVFIINDGSDGSDGKNGDWPSYVFKKSDTKPDTPTDTENTIPTSTDATSPNYGWEDAPYGSDKWWMSMAIINGTTGKPGEWSDPVQCTAEDGDTRYTDFKFCAKATTPSRNPTSADPSEAVPIYNVTGTVLRYLNVDSWYDDPPTPSSGQRLWMIKAMKDADGSLYDGATWSSPVPISGEKGEDGSTIKPKGTFTEHYASTTDMPSAPSASDEVVLIDTNASQTSNKYLWIAYSDEDGAWAYEKAEEYDAWVKKDDGHIWIASGNVWVDSGVFAIEGPAGADAWTANCYPSTVCVPQDSVSVVEVRITSALGSTRLPYGSSTNPTFLVMNSINGVASGTGHGYIDDWLMWGFSTEERAFVIRLICRPNDISRRSTLGVTLTLTKEDGSTDTQTIYFAVCTYENGEDGKPGAKGATPRPTNWEDCDGTFNFEAGDTENGEVFLDYTLYNGLHYLCVKGHTKGAYVDSSGYPVTPAYDSANGATYWKVAADWEMVATKLILAEYGVIKNLGAEGIYMTDSNGNIIFRAENGEVECNKGTFTDIVVNRGTFSGHVLSEFVALDESDAVEATDRGGVVGYMIQDNWNIIDSGSGNLIYLPYAANYVGARICIFNNRLQWSRSTDPTYIKSVQGLLIMTDQLNSESTNTSGTTSVTGVTTIELMGGYAEFICMKDASGVYRWWLTNHMAHFFNGY